VANVTHALAGTSATRAFDQVGRMALAGVVRMPAGVGGGGGAPDADWIARSAGAVAAYRLDSSAEVDDFKFADSTVDHISFDSVVGALKHAVLNTDSTASGQTSVPFGTSFGNGSTFWVSYRVRQEAQHIYAPWAPGSGTGHKLSIISRDANGAAPIGSNQLNEIVVQQNYNGGEISGYRRTGGSMGATDFDPFDVAFSSPLNGTDFRQQPSVDRGANRLTGTNPDTGAAWTAAEQSRARYALTYGARSSPGVSNYALGFGDPLSGGFRARPGEWVTITFRVEVGTFGSNNNRVSCWAAHEGEPYVLLWDFRNIVLGAGPDYTAINLLPYTTGRDPGGRNIAARTNAIAGVTLHVCGLSTPIGDGSLEYNASTQRLRWAGSGQSFGTARGFSAANGILTIPLHASGASGSYLIAEINPAALPSSGTHTETVTIADGRPQTAVWYRDVIAKSGASAAINAPGGFQPLGVSALEDLIASLAADAWGSITVGGLTQSLITRGDSDSILSYSKNGQFDPVTRTPYFWGSTHGGLHLKRLIKYSLSANAWSADQDGVPETDGSNSHGYWHYAIRPSDGRQFHRHYASSSVSTRMPGGSWSAIASLPGTIFYDWNVGNAMAWMPALNGGSGGLVFAGSYTVYGSNATYTSWTELHSVVGLNGDYHNAICVGGNGLAYFGGGNGSTNFWRVNANGTVTQRANLPFSVGADGAGGQGGLFTAGNGKPIAISSSGSIREFDDTTNTWSAQIGTLPFSPDQETYFAFTMPGEGVGFVWISGGLTPSTSMYFWKH